MCRRLRALFPTVDLGAPELSPHVLGVLLDFLLVPLIHSVPSYQTFRSRLFCYHISNIVVTIFMHRYLVAFWNVSLGQIPGYEMASPEGVSVFSEAGM